MLSRRTKDNRELVLIGEVGDRVEEGGEGSERGRGSDKLLQEAPVERECAAGVPKQETVIKMIDIKFN